MKKALLAILLVTCFTTGTFSQALYSSTAYTSRFNPGVGSNGTPIVAYDDVSIPVSIGTEGDSIIITKINVGIRRTPFAPATMVSIYYTPYQDEKGVSNKNINNIFLGRVSLPANGGSLVTSVVTLGDSVTALFKVKKEMAISSEGYQKILIGASLDNPSPANGIVLTKEAHKNQDSIWVVNRDADATLYATSFSGQSPASYYLEVFGSGSDHMTREDKAIIADVASDDNNRAITKL